MYYAYVSMEETNLKQLQKSYASDQELTIKGQRGVSRSGTYHYGTEGCQLVVEHPCFLDITCLEGHLQTAASHSESHTVHIDVVWFGGRLCLSIISEGTVVLHERPWSFDIWEN